jgi:hypothetical protein
MTCTKISNVLDRKNPYQNLNEIYLFILEMGDTAGMKPVLTIGKRTAFCYFSFSVL